MTEPGNDAAQASPTEQFFVSMLTRDISLADAILDLPALSTLERLTMESADDAQIKMGFTLPKSDMGEYPFDVFKKFYRIYPHFSRVELWPIDVEVPEP